MTSIRTLEKQIRRLKASEYAEAARGLLTRSRRPAPPRHRVLWMALSEPVAPTLAKYVGCGCLRRAMPRDDLASMGRATTCLPRSMPEPGAVDLAEARQHCRRHRCHAPVLRSTDRPFRELVRTCEPAGVLPSAQRSDRSSRYGGRTRRDELPRAFRNQPYTFEIVMDIPGPTGTCTGTAAASSSGRRYSDANSGSILLSLLLDAGLAEIYGTGLASVHLRFTKSLPAPASQYLLPFATRSALSVQDGLSRRRSISHGYAAESKDTSATARIAWEMKENTGARWTLN